MSIVTAWSEQCSVMDETTYADPRVRSLIEGLYVPVRVDADRRPDLSDRYHLGGWPTTAFLTPSGAMLSGGTYFTPAQMIAVLEQVAAACRDRGEQIEERRAASQDAAGAVRPHPAPTPLAPDHSVVENFTALLLQSFDPVNGGFGHAPKLPHPYALLFALSLVNESEHRDLQRAVDVTLDALARLWDPVAGGFRRYADGDDWTDPATEKMLDDNGALLHVFVQAAVSGRPALRDTAASLVSWVRDTLTDEVDGGFYNAQAARGIDRALYVDRNAIMAGAFIQAGALFEESSLRDVALKAVEAVIAPAYAPGNGVAHVVGLPSTHPVRGLLTDQIHAASALIWAHAATGQLPYSMLAAELVEFALRTMWDARAGRFRDRVAPDDPILPFELNCHAACVLDRLALLTGETRYAEYAVTILRSLLDEYSGQGLFAAPYALAVREVIERHPPAGLELGRVDWQLG